MMSSTAAPPSLCLSVLMPSAQTRKILEKTGGTTQKHVVCQLYKSLNLLNRKNFARSIWVLILENTSYLPWYL